MVQETLFQQTQKNTPLSWAENNIKNNILVGILKRVINDKSGSKNNKMSYASYPKLLKEYENLLLWINQKTIK